MSAALEPARFSITGEFITRQARALWQEGSFKKAINLLECLEGEGAGLDLYEKILEGKMQLTGVNELELAEDNWTPPDNYPRMADIFTMAQEAEYAAAARQAAAEEQAVAIVRLEQQMQGWCTGEDASNLAAQTRNLTRMAGEECAAQLLAHFRKTRFAEPNPGPLIVSKPPALKEPEQEALAQASAGHASRLRLAHPQRAVLRHRLPRAFRMRCGSLARRALSNQPRTDFGKARLGEADLALWRRPSRPLQQAADPGAANENLGLGPASQPRLRKASSIHAMNFQITDNPDGSQSIAERLGNWVKEETQKRLDEEGLTAEFCALVDLQWAGDKFPVIRSPLGKLDHLMANPFHDEGPELEEVVKVGEDKYLLSTMGEADLHFTAEQLRVPRARYLKWRELRCGPVYERMFSKDPRVQAENLSSMVSSMENEAAELRRFLETGDRSGVYYERNFSFREQITRWAQDWAAELAQTAAGAKTLPYRETPHGSSVVKWCKWLAEQQHAITQADARLAYLTERIPLAKTELAALNASLPPEEETAA